MILEWRIALEFVIRRDQFKMNEPIGQRFSCSRNLADQSAALINTIRVSRRGCSERRKLSLNSI